MNQRQGTVSIMLSVVAERGVNYELNGPIPFKSIFTKTDETKAIALISQAFFEGKIDMTSEAKAKYNTLDLLKKKYVPGLVNNWVRKAPELNGSVKYEAKNPGSRSGQGDETLKALRNLIKCVEGETKAEVQAAIDERLAELQPTVTINVDALPEHLRHLV